MIKSTLFFLFVVHGLIQIYGDDDPVREYLTNNTSANDGKLFAGESWSQNSRQVFPAGGYLFRFDVPMGPNRRIVTFVASSLRVDMKASSWSVYLTDNQGGFDNVSNEVEFGGLDLYLASETSTRSPILSNVIVNKKNFYFRSFYFDSNGKWTDSGSLVERDVVKEEVDRTYFDQELQIGIQQHNLGSKFVPTIEKILLAEYLNDPSVKWRICKDSHIYGQQADPDEQKYLREAVDFTPEKAALLWRKIRKPNEAVNPSTQASNTTAPSTPPAQAQLSPPPKTTEPDSILPWLIGAILLFVAGGTGFWFFRKNKA